MHFIFQDIFRVLHTCRCSPSVFTGCEASRCCVPPAYTLLSAPGTPDQVTASRVPDTGLGYLRPTCHMHSFCVVSHSGLSEWHHSGFRPGSPAHCLQTAPSAPVRLHGSSSCVRCIRIRSHCSCPLACFFLLCPWSLTFLPLSPLAFFSS